MDWTALSAIAELLGAAAVVVSLLYLAQQIRQNTRQIRLAAQQATVHELGNALRAQAQNREWTELLSRGLNNLDALDPVEKTQFLTRDEYDGRTGTALAIPLGEENAGADHIEIGGMGHDLPPELYDTFIDAIERNTKRSVSS